MADPQNNNGQQVQRQQTRELTAQEKAIQVANQQVAEIKRRLEMKKVEIATILGNDQEAERLLMSALMVAADDPKIRECEPGSIVRAVVQAALCGADLTAGQGEGWLLPYKNKDLGITEAEYSPGYRRGQRAIQEATGKRVVANVVHENDHWVRTELPLHAEHTPGPTGARGAMLLSYAALIDDDNKTILFLQIATAGDIEEAKKAARKGGEKDSPAWVNWEDRMWRKVAIMRLAKEVQSWKPSEKLGRVIEADDVYYSGRRANIGDLPPPRVLTAGEPVEGVHRFSGRKSLPAKVKGEPPHNPETGEVKQEATPAKTETQADGKAGF